MSASHEPPALPGSSWVGTQQRCSGNFTESQNHRIVGAGRDLCGSSSPTLLLKQGHLQQAAQDLVQAVLNISREGDSTTSLGSLLTTP